MTGERQGKDRAIARSLAGWPFVDFVPTLVLQAWTLEKSEAILIPIYRAAVSHMNEVVKYLTS